MAATARRRWGDPARRLARRWRWRGAWATISAMLRPVVRAEEGATRARDLARDVPLPLLRDRLALARERAYAELESTSRRWRRSPPEPRERRAPRGRVRSRWRRCSPHGCATPARSCAACCASRPRRFYVARKLRGSAADAGPSSVPGARYRRREGRAVTRDAYLALSELEGAAPLSDGAASGPAATGGGRPLRRPPAADPGRRGARRRARHAAGGCCPPACTAWGDVCQPRGRGMAAT